MSDDIAFRRLKVNKAYDQNLLNTRSYHHQFVALEGRAIKKYVKTILGALYLRRVDFWRSNDARNGMLEVRLMTNNKDWNGLDALPMQYSDNVIELYSNEDVQSFERLNKKLIDEGILALYDAGNEYAYEPQNYSVQEFTYMDGSIETVKRPVDFRLVEKSAPFTHTLKPTAVRR